MARADVGKRPRPVDLERVGRYRIVRPLSKGGMALVFEARRESLAGVSPRVAIKLILPEHADSDTFQELFINEARLGASMQHQNLVQIQDFDRDGENFFLVMEYVEGLTFRQVVSGCARHNIEIPIGVIAELGRQACDGLHYAHEATDERGVHLGLVHRDVKPSNLMLNPHGVVKILDFGISKGRLLAERAGAVRGTWGYMAPEQAAGREIGPNADVFGLATILYEMASRKPLFRKKEPDDIKRLLDDDHAARMAATLPSQYTRLVGVLVRALQRDPSARYPTAAEFGRALSALLPDPITARDEVVRFNTAVQAAEQGRPVPKAPSGVRAGALNLPGPAALSSPSNASLVVSQPSSSDRKGAPWWALFLAVPVLMALAAGGVWVGLTWAGSTGADRGVVLDMDSIPADSRAGTPAPTPDPSAAPVDPVTPDEPVTQAAAPVAGQRPLPAQTLSPIVVPDEPRPVRVPADGASGEAEDPTDGTVEPAEPAGEEPVIVQIDRRDPAKTESPAETADPEATEAAVEQPEPVAVGPGWITVAAQPYGLDYDVFIDGKLVRKAGPRAPVVKQQFQSGQHFITISAAGGARKQFDIDLKPGEHERKVWDFDRNQWRR
ncbi:MAG: serine/threonine protein kinase [Myxococcota bacterium]